MDQKVPWEAFGKCDDADGANQKYLDQEDDLHAGRTSVFAVIV